MSAHLRPLPRCRVCDKPASWELRNTYNAGLGEYCTQHARKALSEFKAKYETEGREPT